MSVIDDIREMLGQFRVGVTELAEADRKQLAELQRLRITTARQADELDEQREIIARLTSQNANHGATGETLLCSQMVASAQLAETQRGQLDQAALHLGAERQRRYEVEKDLARVREELATLPALTAHVRTLLGILDAIGGYMPSDYQAAIRAAREAVGRGA